MIRQQTGRVLAIDYGHKRLGLALSDPGAAIASPLPHLPRNPQLWTRLRTLVAENEVQQIVLGLPLRLDGSSGPEAEAVQAFGRELEKRLGCGVVYFDERFSTAGAERVLIEGEVRRNKRKDLRDSVAASMLLQAYLESKQGAGGVS